MPGTRASEAARRSQIIRAAYTIASRDGLDALTVRRVAAKAGLSAGLVLFHFESKERLTIALLDHVLATTTVLHVTDDIARIASPLDRLLALLHIEMNRFASEPRRTRLFFDYWARGFRNPPIRMKMRAELDRYRQAFRPMAAQALAAEPERFGDVSADGLAAVAVSFIKGCAVQSIMDPERFDIQDYLTAAQGLLGQLAPQPA